MKTKLLNFLRINLFNQNGWEGCKICKKAMEEILESLENNKETRIVLRPAFNASNICMGFHIEKINNPDESN